MFILLICQALHELAQNHSLLSPHSSYRPITQFHTQDDGAFSDFGSRVKVFPIRWNVKVPY